MNDEARSPILRLNVSIVRAGYGSRVLSIARGCGIPGGTILPGVGSLNNPVLQFLELDQCRKEVVLQVSDCEKSRTLLRTLEKTLHLNKRDQGVSFSIRIDQLFGTPSTLGAANTTCPGEDKESAMHQLIVAIVDKGKGEQVVKASQAGGAKGATLVNARGSGIHETSRLFAMEIEPEKELVMILAKVEATESICSAIRSKMDIDSPGKGILFVQPVSEVFGLLQ